MAAIVALTAQTAAMARGQAPATTQMVLCIGLGTATVYLDDQGDPVGPTHICPDAMLAFAEAVLPHPSPPARADTWRAIGLAPDAAYFVTAVAWQPRARGPPII